MRIAAPAPAKPLGPLHGVATIALTPKAEAEAENEMADSEAWPWCATKPF
jgi:hypothetical protein